MTPTQAQTLPDNLTDAVPAVDSLPVAADSTETAGIAEAADTVAMSALPGSLPGDGYTLWYRRIAAEISDAADGFPHPATQVRYRTAEAAEVFGPLSRIVPPHIPEVRTPELLTGGAAFQGLVLLLAAAYGVLLSRRMQDADLLPGSLARNRASAARLVDEPSGSNIGRQRLFATLLGLLFIGMVAVRVVDLLPPGGISAALPADLAPFAGPALWVGATLLAALIGSCQAAVLTLAGAVTLTLPFIGQLQHLRRRLFVSTLLVLALPLLFFVAAPPGTGLLWGIAAALLSIVTAIVYLMGSLRLFLTKKISILYWFLYLCTVEIFPLSLLWLLAGRGL